MLIDEAGGPLECGTGLTDDEIDRIFRDRGSPQYRAYRAAIYHYRLSEKYRAAAESPWSLVADDPPAPPGANPEFEADPLYDEMVSGLDADSGMK